MLISAVVQADARRLCPGSARRCGGLAYKSQHADARLPLPPRVISSGTLSRLDEDVMMVVVVVVVVTRM